MEKYHEIYHDTKISTTWTLNLSYAAHRMHQFFKHSYSLPQILGMATIFHISTHFYNYTPLVKCTSGYPQQHLITFSDNSVTIFGKCKKSCPWRLVSMIQYVKCFKEENRERGLIQNLLRIKKKTLQKISFQTTSDWTSKKTIFEAHHVGQEQQVQPTHPFSSSWPNGTN